MTRIVVGDCLESMRGMDSESIHCLGGGIFLFFSLDHYADDGIVMMCRNETKGD